VPDAIAGVQLYPGGGRYDLVADRDIDHPHDSDRVGLGDVALQLVRRHTLGFHDHHLEALAKEIEPGCRQGEGDENPVHMRAPRRKSRSMTSMASLGFTFWSIRSWVRWAVASEVRR